MAASSRIALVAGATGLVGGHLLQAFLQRSEFGEVIAVTRRTTAVTHPHLTEILADFEQLEASLTEGLAGRQVDCAYCCLGTTRAKAGSPAAFRRVDLDHVAAFAGSAKRAGTAVFALNSSVGADPESGNLYLRTKGEAEAACRAVGFESLLIFRPGLLRGQREEFRLAERLGVLAAPLTDRLMLGPLARYRSTSARDLAAVMYAASINAQPGETVFEGRDLAPGGGSD